MSLFNWQCLNFRSHGITSHTVHSPVIVPLYFPAPIQTCMFTVITSQTSEILQMQQLQASHCICQTTASSLPPIGAISFNHQTISSALLLAIVHVFPCISVGLICPWTLFTKNWKHI